MYPDDSVKPNLGEGLNKKAQVTLDKVWPMDKTLRSTIKSPEKLTNMGYEEKLQTACIKMGARFVEYRSETGSWVFKVDHFSKYGLQESDDESDVKQGSLKVGLDGKKRLKTSEIRTEPPISTATNNGGEHMSEPFKDSGTAKQQNVLERKDLENTAHSILTASTIESRGLGGNWSMDSASPMIPSCLIRTQLLSDTQGGGTNLPAHKVAGPNRSFRFTMGETGMNSSFQKRSLLVSAIGGRMSRKLPQYSLQSGYDKFFSLPTSATSLGRDQQRPKNITPMHVDIFLPLNDSILSTPKIKLIGDQGMFMSRSFRIGWSKHWLLSNPGTSLDVSFQGVKGPTDISLERQTITSYGQVDQNQISCLEAWLKVSLENSKVTLGKDETTNEELAPLFEPIDGLDTLHAHADEAVRQLPNGKNIFFGAALQETKKVWDLMVALWGRLPMFEKTMGTPVGVIDGHEVTMERKDTLSIWLEAVVKENSTADVKSCKQRAKGGSSSNVEEELALMSGYQLCETCDRAQDAGDHYSAMMISHAAGGSNSIFSQRLCEYMELLHEVQGDAHMEDKRLRLYSLISGVPVWQGSNGALINTCAGLDWKRAFGTILWNLSTPVSSIADAVSSYEAAFKGQSEDRKYAVPPKPGYCENNLADNKKPECDEPHDIKYHLLKLYSDRAYALEKIITPATHTYDQLDHRLGWFVVRVLRTLGYTHLYPQKESQIHVEFASQLESMGLWQWSVFVLLHLRSEKNGAAIRKTAVCQGVSKLTYRVLVRLPLSSGTYPKTVHSLLI